MMALTLGAFTISLGLAFAQDDREALPGDPLIRQWVLDVEEVFEDVLRVRLYRAPFAGREAELEVEESWVRIYRSSLPSWDALVREGLQRVGSTSNERRRLEALDPERTVRDWKATAPEPTSDAQRCLVDIRSGSRSVGPEGVGFARFGGPLPDLPRVRRALALYYRPVARCAWAGQEHDRPSEHILRQTALAAPERLGPVTDLVLRACAGGGRLWIPGDAAPLWNCLDLFRELVRLAPDQRSAVLEAVQNVSRELPIECARLWAVAAYLEDGAPEVTNSMLAKKLRGSPEERLWALAWIGTPRERKPPIGHVINALEHAVERCQTDREHWVAIDAIAHAPIGTGLWIIAAHTGDPRWVTHAGFAMRLPIATAASHDGSASRRMRNLISSLPEEKAPKLLAELRISRALDVWWR